MYRNKVIYLMVILVTCLVFLLTYLVFVREESFSDDDVTAALEDLRVGEFTTVTHRLETIMNHNERQVGERAALALGNILVQNQRPVEALIPLRRAINGKVAPDYARFLFSLAVVEGELPENDAEAFKHVSHLYTAAPEQISPILRHKAHFLLFKLHFRQRAFQDAIRVGETFLNVMAGEIRSLTGKAVCEQRQEAGLLLKKSYCRMQEETRWFTAEAYRELGDYRKAYAFYESIWYETPAGTWAEKAREALHNLELKSLNIKPKPRSTDEYYNFIRKVWNASLHEIALQEMASFIKAHSDYSKADYLLYLKIRSLHALRRNADVVSTMETMRDRYRASKWLPAAGIYAIKALRRSDNTPQIRYWVNWIVKNYPNHQKSIEALYNWGTYLCNVVSKEKGMAVLWRVIRDGRKSEPPHRVVDDAYWKIIWVQRNLKRTDKSIETLEQLLKTYSDVEYYRKDDYHQAGYRKAALYWLGRFKEPESHFDAIKYFQTVLKEYPNHYYGHRAKEQLIKLGVTVEPKHAGNRKPFPSVVLLNDPNARYNSRVITLKSLGLYEFAAEELETLPELKKDSGLQFALADLYARAGNTWSAILIMNRYFRTFLVAGSHDPALVPMEFWYTVYPFHYRQEIETAIKESQRLHQIDIDPYIIAALIRSESLFYPRAISNVGAIGLMQLMPKTVEKLSKKHDLGNISRSELFEPAVNIRLGTLYFAGRVNYFQNWVPAICSYNAGTGPVKKWWKNKPDNQPLDEFIENILYSQTRTYIKNVLGARDNYKWIYPSVHP